MLFDEFGEFFRQMPPALVCNIVLIAVSISTLLIYFVLVKPMLARNKAKQNPAPVAAPVDDLPTLDTLTYAAPPPPAPVIPQRRAGEYTVKLQDGQQTRGVELLAILRDTTDDRLIVQLDSVGYRTLLDQPAIKTRFTALMKELAETIARPDTPRPEAAYVEPEVEALPVAAPYDPLDDLDLPDLDALSTLPITPLPPAAPRRPVVSTVPPAADGRIPGALPDYRAQPTEPKKVVKQGIFRPPKVEFEPVPELNLAGAIEAFLQHKLQHTPDYAGRELHVHAAPGGGVRIQVDDDYYDAVGDIEDAEVREFIADTIAEWQEHQ